MLHERRRSLFQRLAYPGSSLNLAHSNSLGESQSSLLRSLIGGGIRDLVKQREPRIFDGANLQRYLLRHWATEGIAAQDDLTVELASTPGTYAACSNKIPTPDVTPLPFASFNEPCWFEIDQRMLADCRSEMAASVFPSLSADVEREQSHAAYFEPMQPKTAAVMASMTGSVSDTAKGIRRAVAAWLFSEHGSGISFDGMLCLGVSGAGELIEPVGYPGNYYAGDPVRERIATESAMRDLCPFLFGLSVLNSKTGFSMPLDESSLMRNIGVRCGDGSPYMFEHESGPRLRHFVRGHWRTYRGRRSEPLTVWITPHTRGNRARIDGGRCHLTDLPITANGVTA